MRNNFLSCCFNVECFYFEAIIKSRARTTSVPKRAANCCNANILKTDDEEKSSDGFPLLFVPEMQAVIIEIFRTNTTPHRNTSTILFLLVLTDLIRKYFFFFEKTHTTTKVESGRAALPDRRQFMLRLALLFRCLQTPIHTTTKCNVELGERSIQKSISNAASFMLHKKMLLFYCSREEKFYVKSSTRWVQFGEDVFVGLLFSLTLLFAIPFQKNAL